MDKFPEPTLEDLLVQLANLRNKEDGESEIYVLVREQYETLLAAQIISQIPKEDLETFFWSDGKKSIFLSFSDD
jgi:hypothetical protein